MSGKLLRTRKPFGLRCPLHSHGAFNCNTVYNPHHPKAPQGYWAPALYMYHLRMTALKKGQRMRKRS
jgi:hypothetical protein